MGQFIRFCINGCLAVAIQYAVYWLLLHAMGVAGDAEGDNVTTLVNLAYVISYLVSFCCNFIVTSYWTFRSRPSWKRFVGFGGSHFVNFLLQMSFLNIYLWVGVPKEWAAILAMGSAVPINFAMLHFVYRKVKS